MKVHRILAVLGFALASLGAYAAEDGPTSPTGLFLEPGITYQSANSNLNYPSPYANSSAATRGFGVVGRAGTHLWDRFFIAADARYALLHYDDNANHLSVNATSWDIAPVIGFQMRDFGLRLLAGYVLGGDLDPSGANGLDYRFDDANGWRLGAGLKLSCFSVNIEWQRLNYATTKMQSSRGIAAGGSAVSGYHGEGLVASVTFPFEFN